MANQFIYNLTDSWADAGTLFTAIKMNVTDTASNASSLLMDLQVGGTSKVSVSKNAQITAANTGGVTLRLDNVTNNYWDIFSNSFLRFSRGPTGYFYIDPNGNVTISDSRFFAFGSADNGIGQTFLRGPTAATLQLGAADAASPVAQTLQVQSVVAGTTNTAGANFTIKGSAGTGTGAGGSIIFQVAPAGSSGSSQNPYSTALTITSSLNATFGGNIKSPGLTMGEASAGSALIDFGRDSSSSCGMQVRTGNLRLFSDNATVAVVESVATIDNPYFRFRAIGFTSGSPFWSAATAWINRRADANIMFGAGDAASPVAQTLSVQGVVTGTSNTPGVNWTFDASQGTGTGAGGSIIFRVAPAGSSGTAQNALATALTIASDKTASFATSVIVPVINYNNLAFSVGGVGGLGSNGSATYLLNSNWTMAAGIVGTSFFIGTSQDVLLTRDAANTLALRNGANVQEFRVYHGYTDVSNYSYTTIKMSGSNAIISGEKAGTGQTLDLFLNFATLRFATGGTDRWKIDSSGHFITNVDSTYDIGASGANRPRNVYVGSAIVSGSYMQPSYLRLSGGAGKEVHLYASQAADGCLTLYNLAESGFDRLQFGGTTSTFPALKRSGTTLQVRLADDSGDAGLQCGTQTSGGVAFNAVGTGNTSIASITNTTTGTLLQVLSSASNPLMTVNDTTTGTIFSVQSNTAATLFQVNDTSTGTLLAVSSNTGADVFTVGDNGAITANGTTVTSNTTPILNLSQTWNNSGATFTGLKLNVTNTASAAGSSLLDLQIGGSSYFSVFQSSNKTWLRSGVGSSNNMGIGNYTTYGAAPFIDLNQNGSITVTVNANGFVVSGGPLMVGGSDVSLNRDAANVLALRNGANAQTFRVYNSYTDASNGEWLEATFSGNVAYLQTNKNGTGTIRDLVIGNYTGITSVIGQNVSSGLTIGNAVTLNATQTLTLGAWYATPMLTLSQTSISVANHLLFGTDNTYDIGTSTTSRPRNVYIAGSLVAATKSFDIPHPTKQDMRLRYGSLEGPENGVYVRGKIEGKVIDLPDYWTGLVDEDSITVQLTAIGRSQSPYVVEVTDNKVFIDTENHTDAHCYYFIQAERKDVDKLVVEY